MRVLFDIMRKKKFFIYGMLILASFLLANITSCKKEELPKLTTISASKISSNSAVSGGNIYDDGNASVVSRGVVWSENSSPTIEHNAGVSNDPQYYLGTGTFEINITNLKSATKYYIRAFAKNSAGTSYGNELSFTTLGGACPDMPTVTFTYNGIAVTYGTVMSNGRCWLDRNLGAYRVATSSSDAAAYGDLYQWGRAADCHQLRSSSITYNLSSNNTPGHNNYIASLNNPYDCRSPQNNNLWQGVSGTNNPCPSGFRLPTETEWEVELQSWISKDKEGAFSSALKLPLAGARGYKGALTGGGTSGMYWSSTVNGTDSNSLYFSKYSARADANFHRANGFSVRCIRN